MVRVIADPPIVADLSPSAQLSTAYFRLHGSPQMYYSAYTSEQLEQTARRLSELAETGIVPWCIFDNTAAGAAIGNAGTAWNARSEVPAIALKRRGPLAMHDCHVPLRNGFRLAVALLELALEVICNPSSCGRGGSLGRIGSERSLRKCKNARMDPADPDTKGTPLRSGTCRGDEKDVETVPHPRRAFAVGPLAAAAAASQANSRRGSARLTFRNPEFDSVRSSVFPPGVVVARHNASVKTKLLSRHRSAAAALRRTKSSSSDLSLHTRSHAMCHPELSSSRPSWSPPRH